MEFPSKPATPQLVAVAFGVAARIAVTFGLSPQQAAALMRSAWFTVQDMEPEQCKPT